MSTYTVTDNPSQILLGGQGTVSIINNGPSTVYLESDTAVSVLNGMKLAPTGQMTWNTQQPLWAVCNTGGTCQLLVNPAAGRIDASRAKFWNLLTSIPNVTVGSISNVPSPISAETGHCQTILLVINIRTKQTSDPPTILEIRVNWYDEYGNKVGIDDIYVTVLTSMNLNPTGLVYVQLPVVGSVFTASFLQVAGNNNVTSMTNLTILGTDRDLEFKWYCENPNPGQLDSPILLANTFDFIGGQQSSGDGFEIPLLSAPLNNPIWVANLGKYFAFTTLVNNPTGSATLNGFYYRDMNLRVFGKQTVGTGSGNIITHSEFISPSKFPMQIMSTGGITSATLEVTGTWHN